MWIKDGQIYTGGGIILDGKRYWFPTPEQFEDAGYHWVEPTPAPKRYSKLKVVRALGEGWQDKREELEAAGILDEFTNAAFLAENDPVFAPIYANLTDEERRILDEECLYDE